MRASGVGAVVGLGLLAAVVSGCGRPHAAEDARHEPLVERIARAASPDPSGGVSSERYLAGVTRVAARGFEGIPVFHVAARTAQIRRFPCGECHTEPLERLAARQRKDRKAHWEIELRHASPQTLACATCHGGGTMEALRTLAGGPVELDHAYQVCAQCHGSQVKDWAGGAHGKRLGGWAPPRVVMSCPACHDPHRPALDRRWPSRASRLLTARE